MWWSIDGGKQFPAESPCDHIQRSAGYGDEWHIDSAQLEHKQCKFRQHRRCRHISREWFGEGHSEFHYHVHSYSDRTRRNGSVNRHRHGVSKPSTDALIQRSTH